MTNESAESDLAELLDAFQEEMRGIGKLQQERAQLMASASVERRRITVVVNANGVVIETRFAPDIEDLSYDDIARGVVAAARAAAAEVASKGTALLEPLVDPRLRMAKVDDVVAGIAGVRGYLPVPPPVSTAPLSLRARGTEDVDLADGNGITGSSW